MTSRRKASPDLIGLPDNIGLLNWPPSRGPMPAWLRAKPVYVIPPPKIEMVEYMPAKDPKRPWNLRPESEIPRKVAAKPRGKTRKANRGEFGVALGHRVSTVATLKPDQWDLIVGAGIRRLTRGKNRGKPYATCEKFLPHDLPVTVDINYPISKIARVTIEPYHLKVLRRDGKRKTSGPYMTLGYVLAQIARAYQIIYKSHAKWGVWGHALTDLYFESLTVKDNIAVICIGS